MPVEGTRQLLVVVVLTLLAVVGPASAFGAMTADTQSTELTATVTAVTDGDTIDVEYTNGTNDTVRLLGVDTPEVYGENDPTEFEGVPNTEEGKQCLANAGETASNYTKNELHQGEQVTLELDPESDGRGDYGRLLAYVHDDGQNHNYQLIQTGHARVYDSEFTQSERFYSAESDARSDRRGLWHCRAGSGGNGHIAITQIHADAAGNDNYNLNDEYVVLENTGQEPIDVSGWTVSDTDDRMYTFPDGTRLGPEETLTLYTGSGSNTATDHYWGSGRAIWSNDGETVTVSDDTGSLVTNRSY